MAQGAEKGSLALGRGKLVWADATPNVLICWRPASLLGRLLVALPDAGFVVGAIRVFALAMRMRSHFRRPQCKASKAPVGHTRAYRDILNDALAALSIIRYARQRRTLLVRLLPRLPRGVFDLTGSIILSLEFARAKDSKDSTSECVVFRLRRGVASAAPLFVRLGFVFCPVYLLETPRLYIAWSLWCALPYFLRAGLSWRSVAIAEGGSDPFFDQQCDRAGSPVAGGLGHAMFVGAVACDLSWKEGRSSMFGVQGGSREVFPVSIMVVWDSGYLLGEGERTNLVGVVRAHRGTYAEDSTRAGRDVLARRLVTRSVALREVHRTGQETRWDTWRRRGMTNCLDSDAGEPTKAATSKEKAALIGVPASLYEDSVRSLSAAG
ncbi:hypothetical protein CRG98_007450 [Punica granatum]|uniref:Uncharacterized protein n=1 Tax=Punica granatum TaxID=22663 RepID=A0A2I0KUP6_PUNGR|nr:hypothetical protein CRG98_007450 [Punica granatum]